MEKRREKRKHLKIKRKLPFSKPKTPKRESSKKKLKFKQNISFFKTVKVRKQDKKSCIELKQTKGENYQREKSLFKNILKSNKTSLRASIKTEQNTKNDEKKKGHGRYKSMQDNPKFNFKNQRF